MLTHHRTPLGASILLACLGAGGLAAQDGRPFTGETTSARTETHEQRLKSLRKEFDAALRASRDAYRKAVTDAERAAALDINPWKGVSERFDALAFDAEGSEVAAGAWAMIFTNERQYGSMEKAREAFGVLIHDHADSGELDSVVAQVRNAGLEREEVIEGLEQLVEASERRSVRAGSLFTLAKLYEEKEHTRERALQNYRRIAAKYADVDAGRGTTFGDKAGASLFEAEHLQVGMPVPDIGSVDETNSPFKLSDYQGKVVLVDFWGFW